MKTIFEGTVNGEIFNNVNDYNNALTKAIASGKSVSAGSRTYTAKEEAKQEETKPKTVFTGVVNGEIFNNVNDYNNAVKNALEKGSLLDAKSETRTVKDEDECCCNECGYDECCCDKCDCDEGVNLFYGLEEDQDLYLDSITGTEADGEILDSWENELRDNLKEVMQVIPDMSKEDLELYATDLKHALQDLNQDCRDIEKINNRKDRIEVTKGCHKLNALFLQHYERIAEVVTIRLNEIAAKSEIKEQKENTEFIDDKKAFNNLLKKLFPVF